MTRHLENELEKLKKQVLSLSTLVEERVRDAVKALHERDQELASQVIARDHEIDTLEVEIEEECLKILALHQPVAIDLRFIVAVLKINNDLERIGDLAVNIAERARYLAVKAPRDIVFDFHAMTNKVQQMLNDSLEALFNMDTELAMRVCAMDDEVDEMNRATYDLVKEGIIRDPEKVGPLLHVLSVSRHLERIADQTTNIAEDVLYMVDGEIVRHRTEDFTESSD